MTIDLPKCDLRQCRFCSNDRCRAQDDVRDRCEYNAIRAQQQSNDPLTHEELRKMDGEPVWCVDGLGNEAWCLVSVWSNREEKAHGADCLDKNDGLWDATYYGMKGNGEHGLHAVGWLAYRRKPEVQDG